MLRRYRRRLRAFRPFPRPARELVDVPRVLAFFPPPVARRVAFTVLPLAFPREAFLVLRGVAARRRPADLATFLAPLMALRTVFLARGVMEPLAAALPANAPTTPPTTAPIGPAILPTAAPATAPAVSFRIAGMSMFSEDCEFSFFCASESLGIKRELLYLVRL